MFYLYLKVILKQMGNLDFIIPRKNPIIQYIHSADDFCLYVNVGKPCVINISKNLQFSFCLILPTLLLPLYTTGI